MVESKLPKLKIDHHGSSYEGIAAASAIGMALMESSGIRQLIDENCKFDRTQRILSPGMGVKALIGPVFNLRNKFPLYIVNKSYVSAPNDYLFGDKVAIASLNDDALGRTLDTLAEEDLEVLFSKCSDQCVKKYDMDSQTFHDDSTNLPFRGMRHDNVPEGEIRPDYACSPKDLRRDLLHFCYQLTVDGNGLLRHMRAYSGNAADCVMDGDTLDFIKRTMGQSQLKDLVYVADAKFMTAPNIKKAEDAGVAFVSRCPVNFADSVQGKVIDEAMDGTWMQSERYPGLLVHDTVMTIDINEKQMEMRFIATMDTEKVEALIRDKTTKIESVQPFDKIIGTEFSSEEDAKEAIISKKIPDYGVVDYVIVQSEREQKRPGRKPKDYIPAMEPCWIIKSARVVTDRDALAQWAKRESIFVLATDLPKSDNGVDSERYRDGMTADGVVMIYREEYVVEHAFRFMKSGLGIDTVFLQTPSRERAMMFVISIAALITSLADALFRIKNVRIDGKTATMYLLAVELLTTTIELDRADSRLSVRGPTTVNERFFEYTDKLEINPRYLLGHT
ncbi:MAG: IS1634 family transposase [Candidatus Methanomethylophilaceae archaeon]